MTVAAHGETVALDHLGGYVVGGDEATTFPHLWTWLVRDLGVSSVLDVGCGDGVALSYFRALGAHALGIDGVPQDDPHIACHDFTVGPYAGEIDDFDLVWSCEFVEHVEERYAPNFLEAFRRGRLVLMTHADVGQGGYHHVNCRPAAYWIGAMAAIGYALDEETTGNARRVAGLNPSPWNHFARSGLAFRRV